MNKLTNKKLKFGALSAVALAALGMGVASAISLGIESNHNLGAGTSVTTTCQPAGVSNDITVGFSTPDYVAASTSFTVSDVVLGNVDAACDGLEYKVVVADTAGDELESVLGTVSGTSVTATFASVLDTEDIASVSVVIYGN